MEKESKCAIDYPCAWVNRSGEETPCHYADEEEYRRKTHLSSANQVLIYVL